MNMQVYQFSECLLFVIYLTILAQFRYQFSEWSLYLIYLITKFQDINNIMDLKYRNHKTLIKKYLNRF